ncbi:ATP-binding cassette domain-containing protein [Brevibacillus massiliensis]|uniref:hypothetical protein n=1 Tax=Brevibacillus massiliensis TaxID=1118054 RepID=UPI001375F66F|nr:hypothetical protein [Brevibacillus massiliensis]
MTEGQNTFLGQDITGKRADEVTKLGLCQTFQNIRLFKKLTVLENVMVATQIHQVHPYDTMIEKRVFLDTYE